MKIVDEHNHRPLLLEYLIENQINEKIRQICGIFISKEVQIFVLWLTSLWFILDLMSIKMKAFPMVWTTSADQRSGLDFRAKTAKESGKSSYFDGLHVK